MNKPHTLPQLQSIANQVRINIVEMLHAAGSGHTGGALGIADVLTALYFAEMNTSPDKSTHSDRDRFVLSAGHLVPVLYATLAERGYFPRSELKTLRQLGSRLKGHTFRDLGIGVETTGGSLGQGMGVAVGFAQAAYLGSAEPRFRTYCVIGDGESNEGSIWEAAMFAAKQKLDNLCVICDRNQIQLSESSDVVMPLEPLADKWRAFGWHVLEIDGNDLGQILFALSKAKLVKGLPTMIIAHTVPGKGVSFMEGKWQWHGKVPNDEELKLALTELNTK